MIHASYMMIIDMTAMTDNSGWYDDLQTLVGVAQSKRYRVIAGRAKEPVPVFDEFFTQPAAAVVTKHFPVHFL